MDNVTNLTVSCNPQNGLCRAVDMVLDDNAVPVWTANVSPPTINYVAPSRNQIDGLCYIHAPLQSFQTRYAMKLDQLGWYDWGIDELDRSILMSPVPFYQCAGHRGNVLNFMSIIGLVDHCFDPYGRLAFPTSATFQPDVCGYYGRYMDISAFRSSPDYQGCGPVQRNGSTLMSEPPSEMLTYRSAAWTQSTWLPCDPAHTSCPDGDYYELVDAVHNYGPVATDLGQHVLSVIGFDLRANDPIFCYQNSHGDSDRVVCESLHEWKQHWGSGCTFGGCNISYVGMIYPPQEYNPADHSPFIDWINHADWDKNADIIADDTDPDSDGDSSLDTFDCGPNNPYQRVDTDGDLHCEPRLDHSTILYTEDVCVTWCESLEALASWTGQAEGGGQGCESRCRDFDRCITTGIKNINDVYSGLEQCTWHCLTPQGCNSSLAHPERSDCCDPTELQLLDDVCRPIYRNFSNVDSDASNSGTSDTDYIADVCEDAASSRPHVRLDTIATVEPRFVGMEGGLGIMIQAGQVCTESRLKVELGLYGGSHWDVISSTRYEIQSIQPITRVGEIGACGCNHTYWSYCKQNDCPEHRESYTTSKAWRPLDSLQCTLLSDSGVPGPGGTLCDGKETIHTRDEDCSDGICNLLELYWPWRDQTTVQAGDKVKVRVGLRQIGQNWTQNAMYPSQNHVTLPTNAYSCVPINFDPDVTPDPDLGIDLDGWRYVIPYEPPHQTLGEHLGSQAVARDTVSKDLYVFEFDKQMRGPLNPRHLTYASPDTPRIEETTFAAVMGRVKSQLFGFAGTGTQALFVFGHREVSCPDCGPVTAPPLRSELWVAGVGEGLDRIDLAEDIFGPSAVRPPAMARPNAVYDRTMSRLIVAGGGESGQFGVWAYTPHIGRWHELPTPLPADLEGFAMAFDRARHRLYLLGGRSSGRDLSKLMVVDVVKGTVSEQIVPAALARSKPAIAIDPVNRHLYVFGGRRGDQLLGDLWHLDLETRSWTQVDDGSDPTGPGAREKAQMHFERRYGRLWISGGRDDAGAKMPTIWGFATAMNLWQERPLAPEISPDGHTLSGLFSPDAPVVWEVSIEETVPYPGQLTRIGLTSDDPCVGVQVWDAAGERVAMSRHCDTAERVVTFLGQPGERYVVELKGLEGFVLGVPTSYELRLDEATLVPVGQHTVGPAWARPRDLAVVAADTGPVALALNPFVLWSVDLLIPEAPQTLDSLSMPGLATSLSMIRPDEVVVSLVGPNVADLRLVDVGAPAHLALGGAIHLPGQAGRMAAHWRGGRVYTARAGKVEIVDLTGPAGPEHVGSLKVGGLISCLAVHGDRLYVCLAHPGKLLVYDLDPHQGAQLAEEVTLDKIGESVRVHGDTVHVGELPLGQYLVCKLGGSCNTGGQVEVFRFDTIGVLGTAGVYPMGVDSLPYLELVGAAGLRMADGGFDIYRVEAAP